MSYALTLFDDLFARRQQAAAVVPHVKIFKWGGDTVIIDGQILERFEGVSTTLFMPGNAGGPARVRWHVDPRYTNHGYLCWGCPHFGIDEYGGGDCCHPLYLELFGCPQSSSTKTSGYEADASCPMLGLRSQRSQRNYRWRIKSEYIFWKYYDAAATRTAHSEGFKPFVEWQSRSPRIIQQAA